VLSFALQRKRRRRRRAVRVSRLDWGRVAQGLFHGDTANGPGGSSLGVILSEVMEELDLGYALVGHHENGRMQVLHISTRGYGPPLPLRVGMELPEQETYAGHLAGKSESVVIDVASLSGWRAHPACQKLGWETYVGVKRGLGNCAFLSVACFANRPRDYLFTPAEKKFLQDAAAWVEGILAREGKITLAVPAAPPAELSTSGISGDEIKNF
jgi:hypothetical protein